MRRWNWRRWTGGPVGLATIVATLAWGLVLHVPSVLAFPYQQRIGNTIVRAETPIDPHIVVDLARADALLATSPIAQPDAPRELYLTNGGWRWSVLALTSWNSFAFGRPFSDAMVFNISDVAADRITNRRAGGGVRTLSAVIAHETTHRLLARRFGEFAMILAPTWKKEGYCDYVARESGLSDAQAAAVRRTGANPPALVYYDGRRSVAAILAANGGSVDRLFGQ